MTQRKYMFACVNQNRLLMIKKRIIVVGLKYWQHIKPRISQCDTNGTPALFAEHFSKLYSSKRILQNVSGEDVYA